MRKAMGVRFLGEGGLEMEFMGGQMLATYFRAPTLLERFPHADTWMHWIMHPSARSILLLIDPEANEFLLHFQLQVSSNTYPPACNPTTDGVAVLELLMVTEPGPDMVTQLNAVMLPSESVDAVPFRFATLAGAVIL